jgi:hypothetical protein
MATSQLRPGTSGHRVSENTNTNFQFSIDGCRFVFPNVKNDEESVAFVDAEPILLVLFPGGARCSVIAYLIPN